MTTNTAPVHVSSVFVEAWVAVPFVFVAVQVVELRHFLFVVAFNALLAFLKN